MALYKGTGLVLRTRNLSETDKIVTYLTLEHGKVRVVAKSARRTKNRYGSSLEPLSHVSLIYFGKETLDLFRLNHSDTLDTFHLIRENFSKCFLAIYFADLIDHFVLEKHKEPKVYHLLLSALKNLQSSSDTQFLLSHFEINLMSHLGYTPNLNMCCQCKQMLRTANAGFSYNRGGVICERCDGFNMTDTKIKLGSIRYLTKFLELSVDRLDRLKIPAKIADEIEFFTHRLILTRTGRELKSYPFIKQMAEFSENF